MSQEKLVAVHKKLLETANIVYTLKVALSNQDQPVFDTLPYLTIAEIIEKKIFLISEMLEK